jgi:hypothetical protein
MAALQKESNKRNVHNAINPLPAIECVPTWRQKQGHVRHVCATVQDLTRMEMRSTKLEGIHCKAVFT